MKKIVNPCICKTYSVNDANAFCKIEYINGRLSMSGVIGPMRSGNCRGSAGQCVDDIRKGTPTGGWTKEMLDKFCDIWERWHMNDLRPYCEHQKAFGWDIEASEKLTLHYYRMNNEALKQKDAAEKAALKALRDGQIFEPDAEQTFYANLPYSIKTFDELSEKQKSVYEPDKPRCGEARTEIVTRGWTLYNDYPKYGILGKPCPVCGYKYGHEWKHEEVPQSVIDWLWNLPNSKLTPAWC